jgi:hypothetical protein
MKTYWEYTTAEKVKMTEDDVKALLDIELMTRGFKKVNPLVLKPIEEIKLETETWFEVCGILFPSATKAQEFLALEPRIYSYQISYDYKYAELAKSVIEQKLLYKKQDVLNLATVISQNTATKKENEKAIEEFEKAHKEQEAVLNCVWEDYWECQRHQRALDEIIATKQEYLRMTEGNEEVAIQFLKRIYSETEITEALASVVK